MAIKNIIFDLGGVIIDIDYHRTIEAFRKLGSANIDSVYSQSKQDLLFDDFDIGKIKEKEFRARLSVKLGINVTDAAFDQAWNAMLLDLPLIRLEFIKSLRADFNVYLFSNTNDIHLREVYNICKRQNGFDNFNAYFDKQYYSNLFGMRKPNKESFLEILRQNNLSPEETLFVDDSIQHVLGAREAGLHAIHLTNGKSIELVLEYINLENNNEAPALTLTMRPA